MSRLTDLANAIDRVLMRRDVFYNLIDIPMTERRMLVEADALLRAAAAETVGTEWPPLPHGVEKPHNADLHAARVAIADLKAERDGIKLACDNMTWALNDIDSPLPAGRDRGAAIRQIVAERDAAIASLAETRDKLSETQGFCLDWQNKNAAIQRAIDEAVSVLDHGKIFNGSTADRARSILRPHTTKATEANSSATVTGSTPRQWTSMPPKDRSGKWWHAFKGRNYPPCLVLVADECGWDAALMESSVYALWLPWQEGDNANNLPPLPDRDTNRDAVSGSSTRELAEFKAAIKRASEIVAKWPDWKRGISGPGCSPHPLDEVTPTTTPTAAAATPAADACDTRELVEQLLDLVHRMLYETDQGNSRHLFRADLRNAANTLVAAARRGGGA